MLPTKVSYSICKSKDSPDRTVVEGNSLGKFFACRKIKGAWEITHLPSGWLLTDMRFPSSLHCQAFILLMQGDWAGTSPDKLTYAISGKLVHALKELNEMSKTEPILSDDAFNQLEMSLA